MNENMRLKFRTIISVILTTCIFLAKIDTASAMTIVSNANLDSKGYFDEFYANVGDNVFVTDTNGNDVTDVFLLETQVLYSQNDLEGIKWLMASEGYTVHIVKVTNSDVQTYALEQYKTAEDFIVKYLTDSSVGTVLEVAATLKGGFWYNPNTYEVTRTNSPTFNVTAMNAVQGVSPSCNSISTGSSVINGGGKAQFWARATFTGTYYDEHGMRWLTYNYGTERFSFTATP